MIIDASVAFKWLVEEDDSSVAIALLADGNLVAPNLILAEVGNALWKRIARGEMDDPAGAAAVLDQLPEMLTLTNDGELAGRALEMACEMRHPIYDCFYLAESERRGESLITADQRFLREVSATPYSALVRDLSAL
jgi:predicted nucleic acid-binding protein